MGSRKDKKENKYLRYRKKEKNYWTFSLSKNDHEDSLLGELSGNTAQFNIVPEFSKCMYLIMSVDPRDVLHAPK